ncbi:hypothetical protein [Massilia suwonensis]|uniref:DUF4240 domain-containing protein n=1 Tax=Massilia suwonensis TaxID=648895 RepID=A0ABW0MJD9_9BURK
MFENIKRFFEADSGSQPPADLPFDYDDLVLLDAEDLAEVGILEAYQQLHPQLRQYGAAEIDIAEEVDEDAGTYTVLADGIRYPIYGEGAEEDAWVLATIAFFDIVNAGLADASHRFYALYGGNDLAGIFLSDEQFRLAQRCFKRAMDRPWVPVNQPPHYGFPQDEEAPAP